MNRIQGALVLLASLAVSSCAPFEAWFDYSALDTKLQFIGRMKPVDDEGPRYAYPGGTVRFRCDCTGVDVAFQDEGTGGDKQTNYVNILVDGEHAATVQLDNKARQLSGVRGLKRGEHTIELVKRTGPYAGAIRFLGVSLQGTLLDPLPLPERRIEVIGDTVACGYGNEAKILAPTNKEPNTGYHSKNEDNSKAYGSLLGRQFGAQVVTTCMSNRGLQRNPDATTEDTLPVRYNRIFPDDAKSDSVWNPGLYRPDLIVLNVGTPDFTVADDQKLPTAPDADLFRAAYMSFLTRLRGFYPSARIVCTVGPTMNDFYPKDRKHWTLIRQYVKGAVEAFNDPHIYYMAHAAISSDPYGEDWHPTAEVHARMADELAEFVRGRTDLGW